MHMYCMLKNNNKQNGMSNYCITMTYSIYMEYISKANKQ